MSVLKILALGAAAGLALTAPAQAQVSRPNAGPSVTTAGRVAPTARPTDITPGRPHVVDRRQFRPDRGGDDGSHLRRRLHNACFGDASPPSPLCRRVFGDEGAGGGGEHLRERLRNACFNDPNPPSPLCRRVFGGQGG